MRAHSLGVLAAGAPRHAPLACVVMLVFGLVAPMPTGLVAAAGAAATSSPGYLMADARVAAGSARAGYWIANAGQWPDNVRFRSAGGTVTAWITTDGLWLVRQPRALVAGGAVLVRFAPQRSADWSVRAAGRAGPPFHFLGERSVDAGSSEIVGVRGTTLHVAADGVLLAGVAHTPALEVFAGDLAPTVAAPQTGPLGTGAPIRISGADVAVQTQAGPITVGYLDNTAAAPSMQSGQSSGFTTYFGGAGLFDRVKGLVRLDGVVVAVGETMSSDLPVSPGSLQPGSAGEADGFAAAFDEASGGLRWATYLGGEGDETVGGAAVAPGGGLFVAGGTWSADFPAEQRSGPGGAGDLFLVRLSEDGARLTESLVAGGSGAESALAVASGPDGTWVAGETRSADWPDAGVGGAADGLVMLFGASPADARSWRVRGAGTDRATAVAVDTENGGALVAGTTFSPDMGEARTGTDADGWAGWWSPAGAGWFTRFGGTGPDTVAGAAILGGVAGVAGTTASGDFPASHGAWSAVLAGPADAFLATFRTSDGAPTEATLFGGAGHDGAAALTAASGAFDFAGLTTMGVPDAPGARPFAGTVDAFVARADADARVLSATHFGGSGFDEADALAAGDPGTLLLGGSTSSTDLPTTPGAAMTAPPAGGEPGFVASILLPDGPPAAAPAVVALIHGWQGLGGTGTSCAEGPTAHPDSPVIGGHAGSSTMAQLLQDEGFEVWHIHLDSSETGTPPLAANAVCLAGQMNEIRRLRSPRRTILVAHSMGGLVARAYLEDDALYQGGVDTVITLGAPHGGVPADLPLALLTFMNLDQFGGCDRQPALCELTTSGIGLFAGRYPSRREGVRYLAVGGALDDVSAGWLGRLLGAWIPGADDGVVPSASAASFAGARTYKPAEGHTPGSSSLPIARVSYFGPFDGRRTSLTDCVLPFLTGRACDGASLQEEGLAGGGPGPGAVPISSDAPGQEPPAWEVGVARSPVELMELSAGEVATRTIRTDSSTLIGVRWDRPGTRLQVAPQAQIEFGELGASALIDGAPGGRVTLELAAPPDGPVRAGLVTVWRDGARHAALDVPPETAPGTNIPVTMTVPGLLPVSVEARLARPDGTVVTSELSEGPDGVWVGLLPSGVTPGVGLVTASASDASGFQLAASSDVRIGSRRLSLTGRYAARPAEPDARGRYGSLAVEIGLTAREPGPCGVSFALTEPLAGGATLAHGAGTCAATTGAFTATIRVDGSLLRGAPAGPWRVARIAVEDLSPHGAVMADSDQEGFLTPSFDSGRFGPPWRALLPAALVPVRVQGE